jgi:hypothetical protein
MMSASQLAAGAGEPRSTQPRELKPSHAARGSAARDVGWTPLWLSDTQILHPRSAVLFTSGE